MSGVCKKCNSNSTQFNQEHGFWKCDTCSNIWAYDKDDPDYDEREVCDKCSGLGLMPSFFYVRFCPSCYGTGYKPDIK